jgi:hypothetical protein
MRIGIGKFGISSENQALTIRAQSREGPLIGCERSDFYVSRVIIIRADFAHNLTSPNWSKYKRRYPAAVPVL